MSQTTIFDEYEKELKFLLSETDSSISSLKQSSSTESYSKIDSLLNQINDRLKEMDIEVRGHDAMTRKPLAEKVTGYKTALADKKAEYARAKEASQRSALIGDKSAASRQQMVDTVSRIDRQNETILNATRLVAETEEVGIETTSELAKNRQQIESARSKNTELGATVDESSEMLKRMQDRGKCIVQ